MKLPSKTVKVLLALLSVFFLLNLLWFGWRHMAYAGFAEGMTRTEVSSFLFPTFASKTGSVVPGVTGTPAAIIVLRASDLFPIRFIISALGPMKAILHFSHSSANFAFSERKPNPG